MNCGRLRGKVQGKYGASGRTYRTGADGPANLLPLYRSQHLLRQGCGTNDGRYERDRKRGLQKVEEVQISETATRMIKVDARGKGPSLYTRESEEGLVDILWVT